MAELRSALESLADVRRTELGTSAGDGSTCLLVTHAVTSSLVRHLISIHLEFRLLTRGEDALEIEVLGSGALGAAADA
jgi:hypothetical protein